MRGTIGEALDGLAAAEPERVAVRAEDAVLTRAELAAASRRAARLLIEEGVRPDDLVTIRLANSAAFVVAACAVWRAGATPQPLSSALNAAEQSAVLRAAAPRLVIGGPDDAPAPVRTLPDLADAARFGSGSLPPLAAASWKAPATSGSTGVPKIVLANAPARVDTDRPAAPFLPLRARQLVAGPLTASATFTYAFRGLTSGHELTVLPRFAAAAVLDSIARHRITWALLVPTMLHRVLRLPAEVRAAADLSSIETIVHLGAPLAPADKRAWLDWLGPERLVEVYAGSESNGLTMIGGRDWLAHPGSVGRPVAGSRIRIVLPDGTEAPTGAVGRVQMRRDAGPASHYLGRPSALVDGWDSLGDDGHLDAEGYLYLADRGSDVIERAGAHIRPALVEQALEAHPAVRSAVATGVPDDELGQAILAVVDVPGADLDEGGVRVWAAAHLPDGSRPDRIRIVAEPLRDDAGKVRRSRWAASDVPE